METKKEVAELIDLTCSDDEEGGGLGTPTIMSRRGQCHDNPNTKSSVELLVAPVLNDRSTFAEASPLLETLLDNLLDSVLEKEEDTNLGVPTDEIKNESISVDGIPITKVGGESTLAPELQNGCKTESNDVKPIVSHQEPCNLNLKAFDVKTKPVIDSISLLGISTTSSSSMESKLKKKQKKRKGYSYKGYSAKAHRKGATVTRPFIPGRHHLELGNEKNKMKKNLKTKLGSGILKSSRAEVTEVKKKSNGSQYGGFRRKGEKKVSGKEQEEEPSFTTKSEQRKLSKGAQDKNSTKDASKIEKKIFKKGTQDGKEKSMEWASIKNSYVSSTKEEFIKSVSECPMCPRVYFSDSTLVQHIRMAHVSKAKDSKPKTLVENEKSKMGVCDNDTKITTQHCGEVVKVNCSLCKMKVPKRFIAHHRKKYHPKAKPYICFKCPFGTLERNQLYRHRKMTHPQPINKEN